MACAALALALLSLIHCRAYADTASLPAAAASAGPKQEMSTEVVRFALQGKRRYQTVTIDDLDILVAPGAARYVPILRVISALKITPEKKDCILSFQLDGAPKVVINAQTREVTLDGKTKGIDLVQAESAITQEQDVYLPVQVVAEMLAVEMVWDEQQYAVIARTDRKLAIWEYAAWTAGMAEMQAIGVKLPELLPPAHPTGTNLDFVRYRLRTDAGLLTKDASASDTRDLSLSLWGKLLNGQCRLDVNPPSVAGLNSGSGYGRKLPLLNWGEWTYLKQNSQLVLGDSRFGLGDLVLPYVTMTGVRVNGILGKSAKSKSAEQADYGLRKSFLEPRTYQGFAKIGSKVQLFVNDRIAQSDEVTMANPNAPAGMGVWTLENVGVPGGRLSEIRIVITDPSGSQTVQRQNIVDTPELFPAGRAAYVAAIGTNRGLGTEGNTRGMIGGARLAYGLSPEMTVGIAASTYSNFFEKPLRSTLTPGDDGYIPPEPDTRDYPTSGSNAGIELTWHPITPFVLYGNMGISHINEPGQSGISSTDSGKLLKGDFYLSSALRMRAQLFDYGPHFFNGQSLSLYDRKGYTLSGQWDAASRLAFEFALGRVARQFALSADSVTQAGIRHLAVSTTAMRRTSAVLALDAVADKGGKQSNLTSLTLRSTLPGDVTLNAFAATGDSLIPRNDYSFLTGVSIPYINIYESARMALSLDKRVSDSRQVGLSYFSTQQRKRISLVQNLSPRSAQGKVSPIQWHTEIGRDLSDSSLFLDNLVQYTLRTMGDMRIGLRTRFDQGKWTIMFTTDSQSLYGLYERRFMQLPQRGVEPDTGAVHGSVFMDYNCDGHREPGEPGLSGVRVTTDSRASATTDSKGYFVLPTSSKVKETKVSLDMRSVPANLSATHGAQTAFVNPCSLTEINLGVVAVSSVSGKVIMAEGSSAVVPAKIAGSATNAPDGPIPVPGVKVMIVGADGKTITDSVTAADGTFYLGDLHPGRYTIKLDPDTIPNGYTPVEAQRAIEIHAGKESQEITEEPFKIQATAPK